MRSAGSSNGTAAPKLPSRNDRLSGRLKLSVLISGRGSNLQALIDASLAPGFPAEIVRVISNVPGAGGLERASTAGIPTAVVPHKDYPDRESFESALDQEIRSAGTELIALAGFMRLLTGGFVDMWRDRLINIHPSLLPSFKGLHTHERALEAGVRYTGCTVHYVRPAMDEGPIIVQSAVPVLSEDDADTLAGRVLVQEHAIYPLAVRLIAEGRVRVDGERAVIDGENVQAPGATINPLV
ncbi:MAG: phosphoribosylglycinamide formyltransferase [Alphaproteobacteria bacterium]|jgi:phosphoribosylglycinamide formyltransferase 1|nr:phosphoribosylglycinamide formyltransferase [Alphaproteobacteria bacterium]